MRCVPCRAVPLLSVPARLLPPYTRVPHRGQHAWHIVVAAQQEHTVHALERARPTLDSIEIADDEFHAAGNGGVLVAHQRPHGPALLDELTNQLASYVSGRSGHENLERESPADVIRARLRARSQTTLPRWRRRRWLARPAHQPARDVQG